MPLLSNGALRLGADEVARAFLGANQIYGDPTPHPIDLNPEKKE